MLLVWVVIAVALPRVALAAENPVPSTWEANGVVSAVLAAGKTVYIGGGFTYVGPITGSGVPLNALTGSPVRSFPKVDGEVRVAVSDGAGGFYMGGWFSTVGGIARSGLAHVLADGSVDSAWNPNPDGGVWALAVSGSTVYAGGAFSSVGG